ncbi:hypothetical protein MTR67_026702 [Solanum verrucosum]|uniref:Uncharacterized protein n=1 Tax=Solanum verrucosum TaxID=315347 RepID=A0AAF0R3K7_SOLVR|nr:hypothetical protein MTR67_026702 [Solanum verrucosum]
MPSSFTPATSVAATSCPPLTETILYKMGHFDHSVNGGVNIPEGPNLDVPTISEIPPANVTEDAAITDESD